MARIKTFKTPSEEAPFLRQNLQRIDVPRDAFGEEAGRAVERLGITAEGATKQFSDAMFRNQQRRNITAASGASKDVPLNALNDLNVMKSAAVADPRLLPGFAAEYVRDFDAKAKIIRDGLPSEGARLQFDNNILKTRTSMAKNAIKWARDQEVVVGRNNANSEIQNEITVAAGDIGNLDAHRLNVIDLINEAEAAGFLVGDKISSAARIQNSLREIDIGVVQALIQSDPVALGQMIENGQLPGLTDKDVDKTKKDITSSIKHIDDRLIFAEIQETLAQYPALNKEFKAGTLTYGKVDNLQTNGVISEVAARVWKNELIAPERKTEEQLTEEAIEKETRRLRIKGAVQEATGQVKIPKLTDPIKDAKQEELLADFTENMQDMLKSQKINSIDKLNEVLVFADKVFQAHEDGAFVGRKRQFEDWMDALIPSMEKMVDSKYLEGFGRPGVTALDPFFGIPITFFSKPKNVFADNYLASMRIFEETSPFFSRVDANKVEVMSKTLVLLKQAEGIEDIEKRKEFMRNIPTTAVTELLQELNPNGNYDNLNQTIRGVNFQAAPPVQVGVAIPPGAVTFLTGNPTDENVKQFNDKFGEGEAERILAR